MVQFFIGLLIGALFVVILSFFAISKSEKEAYLLGAKAMKNILERTCDKEKVNHAYEKLVRLSEKYGIELNGKNKM